MTTTEKQYSRLYLARHCVQLKEEKISGLKYGETGRVLVGPRQLMVTGDPTMQEHENYVFTLTTRDSPVLLHEVFFVSQQRMANPRVSVPLILCFEGLSRTKVETTSSLTSHAKVNFILKASFGINSFYFLK